jgi:WD40 repeat protein
MTLISGGADHALRLWQRSASANSWQLVRTQTRAGEITGLSLSDDGKLLVIAETPRTVALLSVPDLALLGQHTASSNVYKASISPGGQWISTGLWDRSIELVNIQSGPASIAAAPAMSLIGHAKLVTAQAFDPSGTLMASASLDGLVKLWEVGSSEPSPESATAAGPASARVALAPPSAPSDPRRCLLTLDAHAGEAYTAVFLPPPLGHQLAVGYRDGTVRIWDLRHYERHIAGQVDYQARLRGSASGVPIP